jgi:hypothetical protein
MSLEVAIAENTAALRALLAHFQVAPIAAPAEPAPRARKAKAEPAEPAVAHAPVVAPKFVAAAPEPEPEPVKPAPAIGRGDVAALISKAINANLREEVRAAMKKVGADRFSQVADADLGKLAALVENVLQEAA